ncbi:MAG: response regulator transcription factor [Sphingomonadales bacterium]|nr:response regulator transcription factor [Sphingomonadales bacterium]
MSIGHILLVEDEPAIVASLRPALDASGYAVTVARDGAEAIAGTALDDADVILLDLGLPDMDGKAVIDAIRTRYLTPIIVISARRQEAEKIAALDRGADDYVDKPFVLRELLARIRAAMRRRQVQAQPPLAVARRFIEGELEIDFATREVRLAGDPVKLSPKEYNLLRELAENVGQVVTQRRLLAAGWGKSGADPQYLRVYMGMLRQKLEANPSMPALLVTEPGVGYRLVARD